MNAMEILRNEINKKRKLASDLIEKSRETSGEGDGEGRGAGNVETIVDGSGREKKIRYFRQSDLMKEKERVAIEKNLELESKKQEQQRRRLEDEEEREERGKHGGRDENEESEKKSIGLQTAMLNNLSLLTVDEIKHRLRGLGHPVTLFGESPMERIQRLVTAQLDEEDDNTKDEYRLTAIGHDTNHHSHQDDQHHHSLLRKKSEQKGAQAAAAEDEEDDDEEKDQSNSSSYIRGNICTNYSSPSSGLSEEKVIYKYFRNLLKQWEWDLDDREDYLKQTAKGKMETKTQKQCKDYIRPLFKLCKKKEVPGDILIKLGKIVKYCEEGNFRLAHDEYLQAAIGNSAWPIGLTMVGIHERSGREKISTSKVAHVMNNEMQRKYFTSVKRLMSYAQSKRPDVAPSMKSL